MAGLPLDRPIPGTPLLDPLGQAPALPEVGPPPQWPPPFAEELAGPPAPAPALSPPLPFPPPNWFATPEGAPPGVHQNQDVPVVENEPPPPEPPATGEVGPQGLATLEEARAQGVPPQPPAQEQDPYLAHLEESRQRHAEAMRAATEAEQRKNDFEREQGLKAAEEYQRRQDEADRAYAAVQKEAKDKRAILDQEAQNIANTPIDQGRVWRNTSFAGKLFMGVSAALAGASTASIQGGRNNIVDAVNGLVERDLKAQAMDLENRTNMLGVRRGLLAEDLAAGRDMLDVQYKAAMTAYNTAGNMIKAEMLKYDNEALTAKGMEYLQQLNDAAVESGMKYMEARRKEAFEREKAQAQNQQAWAQIALQRRHQKMLEDKEAREAAAGGAQSPAMMNAMREADKDVRQREIRGSKGQTIGMAKTEDEQKAANQTVVHRKSLETLYKRGLELFKDDWAAPGTERRMQQDAWNKNWAQERRMASGDTSAPNVRDQEIWGLDTSRTIGDNMDALNESYSNAIALGRGVLEHSGVDEKTLIEEGFIEPPAPPTPGYTEGLVYYDEDSKTYNTKGKGTPLSPERSAQIKQDPNYAVEGQSGKGIWWDEKVGYNTAGVGTKLSPGAEAQVRANRSIQLNRSGLPPEESPMWREKAMKGQGMPATEEDQDWSVVDPKYWPQWYREKVRREKGK